MATMCTVYAIPANAPDDVRYHDPHKSPYFNHNDKAIVFPTDFDPDILTYARWMILDVWTVEEFSPVLGVVTEETITQYENALKQYCTHTGFWSHWPNKRMPMRDMTAQEKEQCDQITTWLKGNIGKKLYWEGG